MSDLLKISSISQDVNDYMTEHRHYPGLDSQFVSELTRHVQEARSAVYYQIAPPEPDWAPFKLRHGAISPAEVIVALGSAGVFTVVYQCIASYLTRNQGRELTLTKGDVTITIKGHSLPDQTALIAKLAPELLAQTKKDESAETKKSKKK